MPEFDRVKGVQDHFGDDADLRRDVEQTFRENFENFGAQEVIPPALESAGLLNSKSSEDLRQEGLYYTFTPRSFNVFNEALQAESQLSELDSHDLLRSGLRFDGTVGVARILAQNKDLSMPVKWFYNLPVWRYEDVNRTRWREFWQSGIEYLGTDDIASDAEIVSLARTQFEEIGLPDTDIFVNNRKFLRGVMQDFGISEDAVRDAYRIVNKLGEKDETVLLDECEAKGFERDVFESILQFLDSCGSFSEITELRERVGNNAMAREGLDELEKLYEYLQVYGAADHVEFSASLARGLDYYTGIIFEVVHPDVDGSLAGGGRYDDLVSDIGGRTIPGVGFAIGTDRLMALLRDHGRFEEVETGPRVYVIPVSGGAADQKYAVRVAKKVRNRGLKTDIDFSGRSISTAFSYADRNDIPYTIVVGEDERTEGTVTLHDMETGTEHSIPFTNVGEDVEQEIERATKREKWWS